MEGLFFQKKLFFGKKVPPYFTDGIPWERQTFLDKFMGNRFIQGLMIRSLELPKSDFFSYFIKSRVINP